MTTSKTGAVNSGSQAFDGLIGQPRARRLLARLAASESMPHAILFCGPDGSGRPAAALAFLRALFARTSGERAMRRIDSLSHPDVSVLFPCSKKDLPALPETLQRVVRDPYGYVRPEESVTHPIETVRDLLDRFSRRTYEGNWRAAIILHAHQMLEKQASVLLKMIEEPPANSLIILTAPRGDALLPTLVSRCQVIRFPHLPETVVAEALVKRESLSPEKAVFIGRACGGSYRRALEMAREDAKDIHDHAYRFLEALLWGEPLLTYTAIERLTADRQKTLEMLSASTIWLRDTLIHGAGEPATGSDDRGGRLSQLASVFDVDRLHTALSDIERLREMNRRNVSLHAGIVTFWRRLQSFA